MKLKVADVLVYQEGNYITPLSKVEPASREIVEAHQRLWAVTVYAPAEVRDEGGQADVILAYLGDRMGLRFHRPDGSEVPTTHQLQIEVAARRLRGDNSLHDSLARLAGDQIVASSGEDLTFDDTVNALIAAARENDLIPRTVND